MVLCLISAVYNTDTCKCHNPNSVCFLPKLVIERLTSDSDIWGLIDTIMIFMGSIAVLTGVSKFLKNIYILRSLVLTFVI